MKRVILLALLCCSGAACSSLDKPEIRACERKLIAGLKSPSSYKRIDTSVWDDDIAFRDLAGRYFGTELEPQQEQLLDEVKDKKLAVRHTSIEYDADNSYGAAIRDSFYCNFVVVDGELYAPSAAYDPKLAVARPDLSPSSIVLAPSLDGIGAAQPLDMKMLGAVRARMKIGDFLHFILADSDGDEHIWVSGSLDLPLAMILPIGRDPFARLAAAERLSRRLLGVASGPPALRPTPFRRQHLLTLLQVLDGHQAGASRRELAAVLIDGDVRDYSAAEWSDSRQRKRINRWFAEAVELRDGGYLRLLRGH